jgi:hypothetical protein
MEKKTLIVALLVVLGLGVFLPFGNESRTVVERVSNNLGAANTPDLAIGGVRLFSAQSSALTQATSSVICALQAPSSTSTLISAGVQVTTATSGASSLTLSKNTTQPVVGNILATTTVASGAVKSLELYATTTAGGYVFAPNAYLVIAQRDAGVLNQSGACNALWSIF